MSGKTTSVREVNICPESQSMKHLSGNSKGETSDRQGKRGKICLETHKRLLRTGVMKKLSLYS